MSDKLTIYTKNACGECTAVKRMLVKAGLVEDVHTEGHEVQTSFSKYQIDIINITYNEDKRNELIEQGFQRMPVMMLGTHSATGLDTAFIRDFIDHALERESL